MNENPYASPEPVAEDEHLDDREEMRRLMTLRNGLGWVILGVVLGAVSMVYFPTLTLPVRRAEHWQKWLPVACMVAVWLVPQIWGMCLCMRCPRRFASGPGWLIVISVILTLVAYVSAGASVEKSMREWSFAVWSVSVAAMACSVWLWLWFLWRQARGLKNLACSVQIVIAAGLWVLVCIGTVTKNEMLFFIPLTGYGLFHISLLWNLREAIFKEMGR